MCIYEYRWQVDFLEHVVELQCNAIRTSLAVLLGPEKARGAEEHAFLCCYKLYHKQLIGYC